MFLLNTILAWNINIIMNKKYDNNNIIIASRAYFLHVHVILFYYWGYNLFLKWRMSPDLCIEKMHSAFFINLFNNGLTKNIHKKNLKPLHNTYRPDNG
jgi:hypothetical protein